MRHSNQNNCINQTLTHSYVIDANDVSTIIQVLSPIQVFSTGFLSKVIVPDIDFRLSAVAQLKDGHNCSEAREEHHITNIDFIKY